jgi:hypothetical protein
VIEEYPGTTATPTVPPPLAGVVEFLARENGKPIG